MRAGKSFIWKVLHRRNHETNFPTYLHKKKVLMEFTDGERVKYVYNLK